MKQIKITHATKSAKEYNVYLGNGTLNNFPSLRESEYFLHATSKFLTDKLHYLHELYITVWAAHRENWFYFDNTRKSRKAELFAIDRNCSSELDSIRNIFDHAVIRCQFTNGNWWAFIDLLKITDCLELIICALSGVYKDHSNTSAIFKMDSALRNVFYARTELTNYGRTSSTKRISVPKHISESEDITPFLIELKIA